ncbi:MAG: hypothetical protein ACR2K9_05200 [Solirubrobacteraceae bacterium]
MTATFVLPIAHHLVEAVPFVVPVVLLPLVLLGLALRDRLRGGGGTGEGA